MCVRDTERGRKSVSVCERERARVIKNLRMQRGPRKRRFIAADVDVVVDFEDASNGGSEEDWLTRVFASADV